MRSALKDRRIRLIIVIIVLAALAFFGLQFLKQRQGESASLSAILGTDIPPAAPAANAPLMTIAMKDIPTELTRIKELPHKKQQFLANIASGSYGFIENNSVTAFFTKEKVDRIKVYTKDAEEVRRFIGGNNNGQLFVRGFVSEDSIRGTVEDMFILSSERVEPFVLEVMVNLADITAAQFRSIHAGDSSGLTPILELTAAGMTINRLILR